LLSKIKGDVVQEVTVRVHRRLAVMLLAAALAGGAPPATRAKPPASAMPSSPSSWSKAATRDVDAAYRLLLANHPGAYDPRNPGFRATLAAARRDGLALARRARDAAGYSAAIDRFMGGLHDGHAGAFPAIDPAKLPMRKWPGFVAVWRGQDLYVFASEAGGPAVGAEVEACDGQPARALIRRNVFPFFGGRAAEPGNWWSQSGRLFIDYGNPFVKVPKRCVFVTGGVAQTRTLIWRRVDDEFTKWRRAGYNGDTLPIGLSEPVRGLYWIAMPTFDPNESQRAAYRALEKTLQDKRELLNGARAVVLDLRDNQGGSSEWSEMVADALWGKHRVEQTMDAYFAKTEIWWRASPDNAAYVAAEAKAMRSEQRLESADEWDGLGRSLADAVMRGRTYYVEKATKEEKAAPDGGPDPAPFRTPVFVIVPGQCASACLDALDVFTRFPNTRLIGAPSSADSNYLDIRVADLPSGLAKAIIPNKMWVNRPRKAGEVYRPSIEVRDLDWSTANFLAAVERELAKAGR
jgi:hypothetical protein